MRIPRDVSGAELIKKLKVFGYAPTRQVGSHVRVTTRTGGGEHHLTVPLHAELRVGTLSAIISDVATFLDKEKAEITKALFG